MGMALILFSLFCIKECFNQYSGTNTRLFSVSSLCGASYYPWPSPAAAGSLSGTHRSSEHSGSHAMLRASSAAVVSGTRRAFCEQRNLERGRRSLVRRAWDKSRSQSRREARTGKQREARWCPSEYSADERRLGLATATSGPRVLDTRRQLQTPGYWPKMAAGGIPDTKSGAGALVLWRMCCVMLVSTIAVRSRKLTQPPAIRGMPAIQHALRTAKVGDDTRRTVAHIPETVRPEMLAVLQNVARKTHEHRLSHPIDWQQGKRVPASCLKNRATATLQFADASPGMGGTSRHRGVTGGDRGRDVRAQSTTTVKQMADARRRRARRIIGTAVFLAGVEDVVGQQSGGDVDTADEETPRAQSREGDMAVGTVSPPHHHQGSPSTAASSTPAADSRRSHRDFTQWPQHRKVAVLEQTSLLSHHDLEVAWVRASRAMVLNKSNDPPRTPGSVTRVPRTLRLGKSRGPPPEVASLAKARRTKQLQDDFEAARAAKLAAWADKHEQSQREARELKEELRKVKLIMGGV